MFWIEKKKKSYQVLSMYMYIQNVLYQGWETLGLILISGLRTCILSMKFHFYTCSQDRPFVSKVVISVNICLK